VAPARWQKSLQVLLMLALLLARTSGTDSSCSSEETKVLVLQPACDPGSDATRWEVEERTAAPYSVVLAPSPDSSVVRQGQGRTQWGLHWWCGRRNYIFPSCCWQCVPRTMDGTKIISCQSFWLNVLRGGLTAKAEDFVPNFFFFRLISFFTFFFLFK
jgi:hypothetical protein